jgi:hypothetical protein
VVGEEIGKHLLEKSEIILDEIKDSDKFEKFDFVLQSNHDIYFDCKFWNDRSSHSDIVEEMKRKAESLKIETKIEAIHAQKVFIINIIGNKCFNCSTIGKDHNIFLIPSLIDEETNKANSQSLSYIRNHL